MQFLRGTRVVYGFPPSSVPFVRGWHMSYQGVEKKKVDVSLGGPGKGEKSCFTFSDPLNK